MSACPRAAVHHFLLQADESLWIDCHSHKLAARYECNTEKSGGVACVLLLGIRHGTGHEANHQKMKQYQLADLDLIYILRVH